MGLIQVIYGARTSDIWGSYKSYMGLIQVIYGAHKSHIKAAITGGPNNLHDGIKYSLRGLWVSERLL